jgi:hypothetical protein
LLNGVLVHRQVGSPWQWSAKMDELADGQFFALLWATGANGASCRGAAGWPNPAGRVLARSIAYWRLAIDLLIC